MTRAATIKNHRLLCLVAAAAMVIAAVMALIVPRVARAAENEGITGSFTVGNAAPVLTEAATLYNSGHTGTVTSMTPQTAYEVKVSVADAGTIDDLNTVIVSIFYDADSDNDTADIPAAGTQACFIMTCTVGGANGTWAGNPSSSTSWSIDSDNCVQPSLTAGSGDFYFRFTPGKVATEATDWDVYVVATDDSVQTDSWYDTATGAYDMLWYGEINVTTASVDWGSVLAGMDFTDPAADQTVAVDYISNGVWDASVATGATWGSATLDINGAPAANNFSVKAWRSASEPSADFVTTTASDCVIDDTGTLTGESGVTDADNTLYLDLGTPFVDGTYSGTITFYITNGS